jgi:hypothetical protein
LQYVRDAAEQFVLNDVAESPTPKPDVVPVLQESELPWDRSMRA